MATNVVSSLHYTNISIKKKFYISKDKNTKIVNNIMVSSETTESPQKPVLWISIFLKILCHRFYFFSNSSTLLVWFFNPIFMQNKNFIKNLKIISKLKYFIPKKRGKKGLSPSCKWAEAEYSMKSPILRTNKTLLTLELEELVKLLKHLITNPWYRQW